MADVKNQEFGTLGFAAHAPPRVKALDGQRVRITGYLMPTRSESKHVREFLILANQMKCCFGREPGFCEYILARMEGEPGAPLQVDTPLVFEGTLHVSDVYVNSYWSGLYSMDCRKIER